MYNPLEQRRYAKWHMRNSKTLHHEQEICLAAFDARETPVCRVVNIRRREDAEQAVRLAATAPEMAETLQFACTYIRQQGMCPWPECGKCRIFATLDKLEADGANG